MRLSIYGFLLPPEIKELKLTAVKYVKSRHVWRQVHRHKSILKLHHESRNGYTNSIIINTLKILNIKISFIIIVAWQLFFFVS